MPDSADLLTTARLLLPGSSASDAQLRLAISTAYYAIFHEVAQAGAERFMGQGAQGTTGHSLLYRSFNHGRTKTVCAWLDVKTLSTHMIQQLGRPAVSAYMRAFAGAFASLQEARHSADYDPVAAFTLADAQSLVDVAEGAMADFDAAPPDERTAVLASMLFNPRA